MNIALPATAVVNAADAEALLGEIGRQLPGGEIVPYLGSGLLDLSAPSIPMTPEALAAFFGTRVALPRRAKGNAWAAAQHIESYKHRSTVSALMVEAFSSPVAPTGFHRYLASLRLLPLIVDTWYEGAMREALRARTDWGEVQGITRVGIGEDRWYRFYAPDGEEADRATVDGWSTILYKPHGSIAPAKNFLISDADYVEVLTEIDIQTPIPDAVKERRTGRSFLFVGCRFNDQLLRTYARQIAKRSASVHYMVADVATLTRNEQRFMAELGIMPIPVPLARAVEILSSAA